MAKGQFNRVRHFFVICMRAETELALSLFFFFFFFNNVQGYRCTFLFPLHAVHAQMFLCTQDAKHKATNAHTFLTHEHYGIVSISVTAEGLATRDCAGLSRHRPDFSGYKGRRLPLVSNSELNEKKKIFCLKKKKKRMLIIITEKLQQCNFERWLASQKHKDRRSCKSN